MEVYRRGTRRKGEVCRCSECTCLACFVPYPELQRKPEDSVVVAERDTDVAEEPLRKNLKLHALLLRQVYSVMGVRARAREWILDFGASSHTTGRCGSAVQLQEKLEYFTT